MRPLDVLEGGNARRPRLSGAPLALLLGLMLWALAAGAVYGLYELLQ